MHAFTNLTVVSISSKVIIMKSVLILLSVIAFVAGESLDLEAVEKEVQKAPLVEVNSGGKAKPCRCDAEECVCCASPKVFGITLNGCVHFSFDATEKRVHMTITAFKSIVVRTSFSTVRLENVCGHLPGKASILGYCLITDTIKTADGVLTSCSTLDITVKKAVAAQLSFTCINIADGKVSFGGRGQVDEAPVRIKVKNPLKVAVDFIKNLFHKKPRQN